MTSEISSGTIFFNSDKGSSNETTDLEGIITYLGIDESGTYQYVGTKKYLSIEAAYSHLYKQYYKGIEVVGGGFNIISFRPDPPTGDPCDELSVYALFPFVFDEIDVDETEILDEETVRWILRDSLQHSSFDEISFNLQIRNNILKNCEYHIVYSVFYFKDGYRQLLVDATDGQILSYSTDVVGRNGIDMQGETVRYGPVNIRNRHSSDKTTMQSPNSNIKVINVFDFTEEFYS
jgi:hypothetical protein